ACGQLHRPPKEPPDLIMSDIMTREGTMPGNVPGDACVEGRKDRRNITSCKILVGLANDRRVRVAHRSSPFAMADLIRKAGFRSLPSIVQARIGELPMRAPQVHTFSDVVATACDVPHRRTGRGLRAGLGILANQPSAQTGQ